MKTESDLIKLAISKGLNPPSPQYLLFDSNNSDGNMFATMERIKTWLVYDKLHGFSVVAQLTDIDKLYNFVAKMKTIVVTYLCEITEVTDTFVSAIFLLDKEKKIMEERTLDIEPLKGAIDLTVNTVFHVTVTTETGYTLMKFYRAENPNGELNKHFIPEDIFKDFKDGAFFRFNDEGDE